MRVTVRLFARLREAAGRELDECDVSSGARVSDVWITMTTRYPALTPFGGSLSAAIQADQAAYRTHSKALAELQELVDAHQQHQRAEQQLAQAREVAESGDPEMKALAQEEMRDIERQLQTLSDRIQVLLIPRDPND